MTISETTYRTYLDTLMELVSLPSVFTDVASVETICLYCQEQMQQHLAEWTFTRDKGGNLLVINPNVDTSQPILYLSAHLDTVGATPNKWIETDDPFTAKETDDYIIGRGVNDCKAGVAFMLHVASLLKKGELPALNIGFLFSFREEGNQGKTSVHYADSFGDKIPISDQFTTIVFLENTVSVQTTPPNIAIYDREPCNMFITVEGSIAELRDILKKLIQWKPVVIFPKEGVPENKSDWEIKVNRDGHICTVTNEENIINGIILSGEFDTAKIVSGDPAQTSVVKRDIFVKEDDESVTHRLILNYRGFNTQDQVVQLLNGISYEETFSFKHAHGSDQSSIVQVNPIAKWFTALSTDELDVVFQTNPGRSDSSAVWSSIPDELRHGKIIPVTCGPGHRSHTDGDVVRKTHGANEGFKKDSGQTALSTLLQFILNFKL